MKLNKYQEDNPNNCRVTVDYGKPKGSNVSFEYVGTRSQFSIVLNYILKKSIFYYYPIILIIYTLYMTIDESNIFRIIYITYLFFVPFLLSLVICNSKFIKLMPYLQAKGHTIYLAEFSQDNIKDNKIEIPLFSNVFLHYKTEGDFNNKLEKIEIIEHPFNIVTYKGTFKRKTKLQRNEFLWKATFSFSEKPKDGKLLVRWV